MMVLETAQKMGSWTYRVNIPGVNPCFVGHHDLAREILMDKLIIALNKVDLVEEIQPKIKSLRGRFKTTKFGAFLPIVPVSAAPK